MKEELESRRQQMKYYLCAIIEVLSLLRKSTPTVTRNRGNSAFCTVIGFTVTGDYEFLRNVLHGIGECVFSR